MMINQWLLLKPKKFNLENHIYLDIQLKNNKNLKCKKNNHLKIDNLIKGN